jgi:DNA-binding NarL/FixJ family response regulator
MAPRLIELAGVGTHRVSARLEELKVAGVTEAQTRSPLRVVLIDDSEEIREVCRLALNREDDFVVVAEASDGEAGIAAVSEHQPHLVLLDIAMPVMDGLQALQLIRTESPGSIVVMLTGFSENAAAMSALEHGAHGFIRKGGTAPAFLSQIRDVLEYRFSRQ